MYTKGRAYNYSKRRTPKCATENVNAVPQQAHPATLIQRTKLNPQGLTPSDVMQLQRTLGNQWIDRLLNQKTRNKGRINVRSGAVVQRTIDVPAFADSHEEVEQERLRDLKTSVTSYNKLNQDSNDAVHLQTRFTHITRLERLIYAWYDTKQVLDLTDNEYLAMGGNADVMRILLRNTETERDAVVTRLRASDSPITFAGASDAEIANLQALWIAIVNQTGKLNAIGTDEQINRLFSRIAAALQTGTGRQILDYMVNRSPNTVTMLFSTEANLHKVANDSGASATDKDTLLGNQGTSFAGQMNLQSTSQLVKDASVLGATALDTPDVLINDIIGATPSAGYNANGVTYRPGAGQEAFAAVKDASVLDPNRQKASSAAGTEVLTPTFVTLMHELGHALKMASGTYMPTNKLLHPDITGHFLPDTAVEDQWPTTSLEEYVNVLGIENPIRKESNISTRDSYETPEKVRMIQNRQIAEKQWTDLRMRDERDAPIYLEEVMKRCGREMVGQFRDINIFDAQTADDVTRRTEPIQHLLLAGEDYQLDIKRSYIVRMTYDFWEFLLRLSPKDAELIKLTQRYRNLNRRFSALLVDNKIELGQRQCDVQEQVTKFIEDRDQLIKAGKEILHVRRYGLLSPKNWRSGSLRGNEETP